jgi:type IX secretion system PorP/SprF family membrane protein
MNYITKICLVILLHFSLINFSQDIHFSQSFASPLSLNPASSGNFDGTFRLNCNYKDQWRSVSKPYKTIYAAADYIAFKKKKTGNYFGIGLSFYNDQAGTSNFATNAVSLSLAYNVKMNKYNFLAAGLGFGFAQKSFNVNGLKWDNQFNGTAYDANLATEESIFNQRVNYMDFSAGLLWNVIANDKNKITIGASVFHLNKPNQAFSKTSRDPLDPKIVIHANAQFRIGQRNSSFVPIVVFTNQGKLNEITAGGMIKYDLGLQSKYTGINKPSFLSLGLLHRVNDAVIAILNIEYKQVYKFGFSYDINASGLTKASKGRGGIELHIGYIGLSSK